MLMLEKLLDAMTCIEFHDLFHTSDRDDMTGVCFHEASPARGMICSNVDVVAGIGSSFLVWL